MWVNQRPCQSNEDLHEKQDWPIFQAHYTRWSTGDVWKQQEDHDEIEE